MRLQQGGLGFKVVAAMIALTWAVPAFAQDEEMRAPLFICGTGADALEGSLQLSGVETDNGDFVDLRFEQRIGEDVAFAFPPEGTDSKTAFLFAHSDGPDGYLVALHFAADGKTYELYSLAQPPDPASEDDLGGSVAGLEVRQDAAIVEDISCGERPTLFPSYILAATSCDVANPLGEAACGEEPAMRTEPLTLPGLGGAD
jgi:hypothetical protein